jgi:hypothetical protein
MDRFLMIVTVAVIAAGCWLCRDVAEGFNNQFKDFYKEEKKKK